MKRIPFNRPTLSGRELDYVRQSIESGWISGDGIFTRRCHELLREHYAGAQALLTHSGTAGLEMAAILCDLGPGDEAIMPSFTFVSTANAVALRGATPVFVDIDPKTLNIDPEAIRDAVTERTRAVFVVHYAGVGCDMEPIQAVCDEHGLSLVEDAAQGFGANWAGRPLGSFGRFGVLSFHETKNVMSGEGGAVIVNDPADVERAEIVREKGTDRTAFRRGARDKYTWQDVGSSYLPSDIIAAFLFAQLEQAEGITAERLASWQRYHRGFESLEASGGIRRPRVPEQAGHNGHIYYLLCRSPELRDALIADLARRGISAPFHYLPLHDSPAGRRVGRAHGSLATTEDLSARLLRLPLFPGIGDAVDEVVEAVTDFVRGRDR